MLHPAHSQRATRSAIACTVWPLTLFVLPGMPCDISDQADPGPRADPYALTALMSFSSSSAVHRRLLRCICPNPAGPVALVEAGDVAGWLRL